MKGSREIKRILVEELGFADLASYQNWIATLRPTIHPTAESIAKLYPDAVDCRAFWKVCGEGGAGCGSLKNFIETKTNYIP